MTGAFDARKLLMSESGDIAQWSAGSLITGLRTVLLYQEIPGAIAEASASDPNFRIKLLTGLSEELIRRGVDAESLVRYGLLSEIISPVVGYLIVHQLLPGSSELAAQGPQNIDEWREILKLKASETIVQGELVGSDVVDSAIHTLSVTFGFPSYRLQRILKWLNSVDLPTLLSGRPPTELELLESDDLPDVSSDLILEYRWIVDRFSSTYLREWTTESLHLEFKWKSSMIAAPCPVAIIEERVIPLLELNSEIAKRAVSAASTRDPGAEYLARQVDSHARKLLSQGRTKEAATLYEFVIRDDPGATDALNNLGFCLIPDDPGKALKYLEKANRRGYQPLAVNVFNRICCYTSMNQPGSAQRLADEYLSTEPEDGPIGAVLWKLSDLGIWELASVLDARQEIEVAAAALAERGDGN